MGGDTTNALAVEDKAATGCMPSFMAQSNAGAGKQTTSGSCVQKESVHACPPKEVIFHVGREAELNLNFGGGNDLQIRFFDDSGRENWRKGLAYYLAKQEKTWTRDA